MKRVHVLFGINVVLLLILAFGSTIKTYPRTNASSCTAGLYGAAAAMEYGGHCYLKFTSTTDWSTAATACGGFNGHLTIISSIEEYNQIVNSSFFGWLGSNNVLGDVNVDPAWSFTWQDSSVVTDSSGFSAFQGNQPDDLTNGAEDGQEDCLENSIFTGAWNDRSCADGTMPYVCECDGACTAPVQCGDGLINGGDACDDGNTSNGDGCNSSCAEEDGWSCTGEPSTCTLDPVCGDNDVNGTDECDDGGTADGDGCSATCTVEDGWSCVGDPSTCTQDSYCGDGIINLSDVCDDGNMSSGDGCSNTCAVESGYSCTEEPSQCFFGGLGALWTFSNTDDTITDFSASANHGTPLGGASLSSDVPAAAPGGSKSLALDGSNDQVQISNVDTNTLTFATWLKFDGSPNAAASLVMGACGSWGMYYNAHSDNKLYFGKRCVDEVASNSTITGTDWHHVAVVLDPADTGNELKFYIDGVLDVSMAYTTTFNSASADYYLGSQGGSPTFFSGNLDETHIYTRALNGTEIGNLASFTEPDATNLLAHYEYDALIPQTVTDSSGSGNHGTSVGNPVYDADAPTAANAPYALQFNATNKYVTVQNFDLNTFTFAAWVRPDAYTADAGPPLIFGGVNAGTWGVGFNEGGFTNQFFLTKIGVSAAHSDYALADHDWHHIAVTYNGADAVFYVDGLYDSTVAGYNATFDGGGDYSIGGRGAVGDHLNGAVDDVRIYNYVLTGSDILLLAEASVCGDSLITGDETCDDGDASSGDGCSNACATESGWSCVGEPSVCSEVCGNGVETPSEQCDDNNVINGDGCDSLCRDEVCGNGIIQSGENCDDGNTNSGDGCSNVCLLEDCGNGIEDVGEQCDDGDTNNGDGCDEFCRDEVCGNGYVQAGEACDDDNTANLDGCSGSCTVETGWNCLGEPSVCSEVCGDGNITGGEECDDDDTANGDGCSSACTVEDGYSCVDEPSECSPTCGDGNITGGEECDDGNDRYNDGCSPTCTIENNWSCAEEPSVCTENGGAGNARMRQRERDALQERIEELRAHHAAPHEDAVSSSTMDETQASSTTVHISRSGAVLWKYMDSLRTIIRDGTIYVLPRTRDVKARRAYVQNVSESSFYYLLSAFGVDNRNSIIRHHNDPYMARGEVVATLLNVAKIPLKKRLKDPFRDVFTNNTCYDAIANAAALNIVIGDTDAKFFGRRVGTFRPDNHISLGELLTLVVRMQHFGYLEQIASSELLP